MASIIQFRNIKAAVATACAAHDPNTNTDVEKGTNGTLNDTLGVREFTDPYTSKTHLLVTFPPCDPHNPKTWPAPRKWCTTITVGLAGALVGWASSIDSGVLPQASAAFSVSRVAESLATALFLIGFGFGALVAGPLSETLGRNPVYVASLGLFACWILGAALAPNLGAQLTFRLLAGACGATPLTTFGGSTADLWSPLERTYVFAGMAAMSFLGPFLAPVAGAFIGESGAVSWRWSEWATLIFAGVVVAGIALFAPETYAPVLLGWKAGELRRITGDERYVAEGQLERVSLAARMKTSVTRPFVLFVHEAIIVAFVVYLSVIYVVLFTFLTGYDFIFGPEGIYGLSQGTEGLCFIGLNVGFLLALAICPWIYARYHLSVRNAEAAKTTVQPEQRLWYAMVSAPFCPVALFWMAWTSRPSISPWSAIIASVFFGFAMMGIFISTYQYLIDAYEKYAASALVSLTFFRYLAAGAMVVVSIPMYSNLGVAWTLSLLGFISVVLTPIPYVLYWYGPAIRRRSKFLQGSS